MSYELVTDSSCNLSDAMIHQMKLHILSLSYMVDDTQYLSYDKYRDTDLKSFYDIMRTDKDVTTSLPNLANSEMIFREILEAGSDLLYIGFSSGISGTYEAMAGILDKLKSEFPERKIYHVDTLAASGGEGLIVKLAYDKKLSGASIEELAAYVEEIKLHVAHWFTVDDLHWLVRHGRVTKTAAFAATLLDIKPVLHVDNEGKLIPMKKMKGRKKSLNAILDMFEETAIEPKSDQKVFITHGDCIEDANYMADKFRTRFGVEDITINYIDATIGAHAGPGTMATFWLASER